MSGVPVLYIGGWGRSGSTLLAHVLAEVPGFVSVGELRYVWQAGPEANELCGCGLTFDECPFWTAVGQEAFGGWENIDVNEVLALESAVLRHRNVPLLLMGKLAPEHERKVKRYAELTASLYRAIQKVSGAEVVVDSTKNPPYAYFLRAAQASGLRLRVLHLVRDSRGAAHSWAKRMARPEITNGDAFFQEFSPLKAGVRWMECNLAFEALRRLRVPTVGMRYEALAADPRGELERMFAEMGEAGEHDLSAVGDSVEVSGQHSVRGNPMRFAHGRQKVRTDEAWRTGMAAKTRSIVVLVTWPLLLRYGYLRQHG
ncbi:MAG TPA: sulfotransferase [Gaiellales bacterium]|nr:sulfotransferase [Gaiellales bacterium]